MSFMTKIFIVCFLLSCVSCLGKSGVKVQSQANPDSITASLQFDMFYCSDDDRIIFDDYIAHITPFKSQQISDLIIETARFFLNKPYVASTLEFEPEGLVVNLREFDCTTLVETTLALSRAVKLYDKPSFENFCEQLRNIRYRRGNIDSYTDRIHYFSDWIYENETRGFLKDVTKEAGGEPYKLNLSFISSHPDSYKQIKANPEYVGVIQKKESEISERDVYSFIPEARIKSCENEMMDGDIVSFVSDIEGLDVSHVGFIYRNQGFVTFIHASSSAKKVIVNPQALSVYVEKNKRNTGVILARPMFYE